MSTRRIAIVGGGLMGAGIAQVFAASAHQVSVFEPVETVRETVTRRIHESQRALGRPAISPASLRICESLADAVVSAEIVIEAAPEKLTLKQAIFADLERLAPPDCTLASNTSVIPIGHIAAQVRDPSRVIGTHWWNPPYLVPLVEVISAAASSPARVDDMMRLLDSVGKKPVRVLRDVPGFVGNRLQHALWREAQHLVSEGVCDAETVDTVVKNSFGLRLAVLGPIENADLVGLDLTLDIHRTIIPELSHSSLPNPLLEQYVLEGRLGFKSGQGFRTWTEDGISEVRHRLLQHLQQAVGGAASPSGTQHPQESQTP